MTLPKSAGEPANVSAPSSLNRDLNLGSASPALIAPLKLVDDFHRCAFWRADPLPADALIAGHELTYGRKVREQLRPGRARHRQCPHRTRLDLFGPGDNRAEYDLDASGDEFGYRRAIAAINNQRKVKSFERPYVCLTIQTEWTVC